MSRSRSRSRKVTVANEIKINLGILAVAFIIGVILFAECYLVYYDVLTYAPGEMRDRYTWYSFEVGFYTAVWMILITMLGRYLWKGLRWVWGTADV